MERKGDKEIFREVQQGNRASFKQLFNRYYKSLCVYAANFLESMDECEDVVQKIYINVWVQRNDMYHIRDIRSYLYKAVRNACYNQLKHSQVEEKARQNLAKLDTEDESLELQAQEEKIRKLHLAIHELPSKTQRVLMLSVFDGLSYKQIAKKMDISMNTVKYHMKTAYQFLRKNVYHLFL